MSSVGWITSRDEISRLCVGTKRGTIERIAKELQASSSSERLHKGGSRS